MQAGQSDDNNSHFIGSVVYFGPDTSPTTSVQELLLIDGQQRLTTISLLLLALTHYQKNREMQPLNMNLG